MKVWIVTAGSYSDFRIEHVFSSEEKAKAYIEKMRYFEREINTEPEEYEVDPQISMNKNYEKIEYNVLENRIFRNFEADESPVEENLNDDTFTFSIPVTSNVYKENNYLERQKKLLKIAQDKFAEYKARRAGI